MSDENQAGTLYDRIIAKLKDNKVVVVVVLAFIAVTSLGQLYGLFPGIMGWLFPPKFHVSASIRPYDFMVGDVGQRQQLEPVQGSASQVDSIAANLAKEIASACGPATDRLDATLEIQGQTLRSSRPLHVSIPGFQNPMAQTTRYGKDLGENENFDLGSFVGPGFMDAADNSVGLNLGARGFDGKYVKIFKREEGLSFDPQQQRLTQNISLTPRKIKLLLDFTVSGDPDGKFADLMAEVGRKLPSFIEVSSETLATLEKERGDVRSQPIGPGKLLVSDQYNVDFVVSGNVAPE